MFDKCLQPGSNFQLVPPCDHCSNALPTELPPLLRNYPWNFVNYRKQIKYCGNSIEIFPFCIRTILRATSMMITDTDNDQLNYWIIELGSAVGRAAD